MVVVAESVPWQSKCVSPGRYSTTRPTAVGCVLAVCSMQCCGRRRRGWLWHTTCPARRVRFRPSRGDGMWHCVAPRAARRSGRIEVLGWDTASRTALCLFGRGCASEAALVRRSPVHGWRCQPALRHSLRTPVTTAARSTGVLLASRSASAERELSQPLALAMVP